MTKTPHITLNNLSFHLDQTLIAFDELNLSFGQQVYGIVGKNGSGKSTLLNLITGALAPNSGSVQHSGTIMLAPQSHTAIPKDHSIADTLEVTNYLIALKKINQGSTDDRLFECLEGQWDIESRIENVLSQLQLWPVDLNMQFHQLSGGQKTKILLARTWLADADFILFDEPTNNLDAESREILYQFIQSSKKGLLIVSHDRTLLNLCHNIIEISSKGVEKFGGNYDFYKEQKDLQTAALEQEIKTNKEYLKKSKKLTQTRMERYQQNEAKGKKKVAAQIKEKGSYDKIELKGKKGQSENTNRRIRLQADKKMGSANSKLSSSLEKLEADKTLNISLPNTAVPNGKVVIDINDLCFSYDEKKPLLSQFNLHLAGPKRIAISGKNGSGKTTLIKIIRGLLTPEYGNITVGVSHIA